MKKLGVELFLVFATVVLALTVLISYVVAVDLGHVEAVFPYISNLGTKPPERGILTLGFNLGAIICFIIVFIRYKQICFLYADSVRSVWCLNRSSVVAGFLSHCGLLIVASFQVGQVLWVHSIGAGMLFLSSVLYQWLQTAISFKVFRYQLSSRVGRATLALRVLFSLVTTLFLCVIAVAGVLRFKPCARAAVHHHHDLCRTLHLLSTTSEWVVVMATLLYYLTFHWEFMEVALSVKVKTRSHTHHDANIITGFAQDTPLTL